MADSLTSTTPSNDDTFAAVYSEADVAAIAERLEQDRYPNLFDCLDDWHEFKAIAFRQPDLVQPYIHLLELEVDED